MIFEFEVFLKTVSSAHLFIELSLNLSRINNPSTHQIPAEDMTTVIDRLHSNGDIYPWGSGPRHGA